MAFMRGFNFDEGLAQVIQEQHGSRKSGIKQVTEAKALARKKASKATDQISFDF